MKILITGASGKVASLARLAFDSDQVTLMSRSSCQCQDNETFVTSCPLENFEWWNNIVLNDNYDIVLHLAEPVRKKLHSSEMVKVIDSHVAFIKMASKRSKVVLYPTTAIRYDEKVSAADSAYIKIKSEVVKRTASVGNIAFPTIHPLIDYGDGLANLCRVVKGFPIFNPFCAFYAKLPILEKDCLVEYFRSLKGGVIEANKDCFARIDTVANIFNSKKKIDSYFFSFILRCALRVFQNTAKVSILLRGRSLL